MHHIFAVLFPNLLEVGNLVVGEAAVTHLFPPPLFIINSKDTRFCVTTKYLQTEVFLHYILFLRSVPPALLYTYAMIISSSCNKMYHTIVNFQENHYLCRKKHNLIHFNRIAPTHNVSQPKQLSNNV